ncbi:MAG: VanZ family protein [Bacillota bacterium]|nr:VanZ family protein [Bacillota bacterium]
MLAHLHFKGRKLVMFICIIAFLLYVFYAAFLLFFSPYRQVAHEMGPRYNLIPLKTITNYIRASDHLDFKIWFTNLAGNVFAFIPLGFFLPLLFKRFNSFWRTSLWVVATTASVEIIQFITHVGSFDVDDIILNAIGGIIGYVLFKILFRIQIFWEK